MERKDALIILAVFALALSLRLLYFSEYKDTAVFPVLENSDGYFYNLWALDIKSGSLLGERAFMKWPFYAFFLSFLLLIFGGRPGLVIFLQYIIGSLTCVLVYLIAKKIFGRGAALISALLMAGYGLFIFYDSLLIYANLSLFLNALLFLFILRLKDNVTPRILFWLGAFLGLCALTQGNIIIFGVLAAALALKGQGVGRRPFRGFLWFGAGLFLVLGCATLRNYLAEKDFVPVQGSLGINFYLGNNPGATGIFYCPSDITMNQEDMFRDSRIIACLETGKNLKTSEVSRFWFARAFSFIRQDRRAFLNLFLKKAGLVFGPNEFVHDNEFGFIRDKIRLFKITFMDMKFIFPFFMLGMLLAVRAGRKAFLLYLAVFTFGLSAAVFFVTARYRLAVIPYMLVFAGFGIYRFFEAVRQRRYLGFLALLAVLAPLFYLSAAASAAGGARYFRDTSTIFEYRMDRAKDCEGRRDYAGALKEIELAHKIEPANRRPVFRAGLMYYYLGDDKSAEERFLEAIKISPACVAAYYNLGFIYNKQQRFPEAVKALEQAVFLDPQDPWAHFELGIAYKAQGENKKAGDEFSLALKKTERWRKADRRTIEDELRGLAGF